MPSSAMLCFMKETTPYLNIYLDKIQFNTEIISKECKSAGVDLWGVTKVVLGDPRIVGAMIAGGCVGLADSRVQNLEKLRKYFPNERLLCIRPPGINQFEKLVEVANISLQSDIDSIIKIGKIAEKIGKTHSIILLMELGDLREGIMPSDFIPTVKRIVGIPGIKLAGIGGILTCLSGVIPSGENLGQLVNMKIQIEKEFNIKIPVIAGGASNILPLLMNSQLPKGINEIHVGESIILGLDVLTRKPIPELKTDTFELVTEVIECYKKPSLPKGNIAQNAMGETPKFEDKGIRKRAILNVGMQDTIPTLLTPLDDGVTLVNASSDHMVVDVEDAGMVKTGDTLRFRPGYSALLHLMDSEYIVKCYSGGKNGT
jgi:ornithine racemase